MKKDKKKKYQFYATPDSLAEEMCEMTFDPYLNKSVRILEPSAGQGAIIDAIRNWHLEETVHLHIKEITAIEYMEENMEVLKKKYKNFSHPLNLIHGDFLEYDQFINYFDFIIANPPFSGGQDMIHFKKMYELCKPGGTITCVMSNSWITNTSKKFVEFRDWLGMTREESWREKVSRKLASTGGGSYLGTRITEHGNDEVIKLKTYEAGTFKSSGTNAITCIIQLTKNDVSGFSFAEKPKKKAQLKLF